MAKLETGPYKGVRDFYPEDQFTERYIFSVWQKVLESYGYEEYSASILEPADLYRTKSGEEIVNEQTYTFTDRGEREVTLRPEMTPTIARMVAQKRRELAFPLRWYSIVNLFRYEAPQKGRLREHWQLNADIFGVAGINADVEVIEIAYKIMREFGAEEKDFLIRLNSRRVINKLFDLFDAKDDKAYKLSKLLDKKAKISESEFRGGVDELLGDNGKHFVELIEDPNKALEKLGKDSLEVKEVLDVSAGLAKLGITNITFDLTLMRGFDYYTGVVFEVFDTDPENSRSLFGGGRYDDLLAIFDEEPVTAFGFGAGDVTLKNFLDSRGLLPLYPGTVDIAVLPIEAPLNDEASELAREIRAIGLKVSVDFSPRKLGDKIKAADKHGAKYIIAFGEDEAASKTYKLKDLKTGEEKSRSLESLKLEFGKGE